MLILLKKHLCLFRFVIDLPAPAHAGPAAAFAVRVFDESAHIFRRVSQEKPDLMRERWFFPNALDQTDETPGRMRRGVSEFFKKRRTLSVTEISLQITRPVQIKKRIPVCGLQRKKQKPLAIEDPVDPLNFMQDTFGIFAVYGKQTSCFYSGQSG